VQWWFKSLRAPVAAKAPIEAPRNLNDNMTPPAELMNLHMQH